MSSLSVVVGAFAVVLGCIAGSSHIYIARTCNVFF